MKAVLSLLDRSAAALRTWVVEHVAVLCFSLGVMVLVGLLAQVPLVTQMENVTGDWRYRVRGTQPIQVPINIIAIDDPTFDRLSGDDANFDKSAATSPGKGFDPRPFQFWGDYHARVIESLRDSGAKAIGFDIIQAADFSGVVETNPDRTEAAAIAATPQIVLNTTRNYLPDGRSMTVVPNKTLSIGLALGGGGVGFANTKSDADGVVRRFFLKDDDGALSFAMAIAAKAAGQEPRVTNETFVLGRRRLELDSNTGGYIDYVGPDRTFPRISYVDLLSHPQKYQKQIRGSICLVGVTTYDYQDYHTVPLLSGPAGGHFMSGVEVQANILHTLLAGRPILRTGPVGFWLCIALAVLAVIPLYGLPRVSLIVPGALILIGLWVAICVFSFVQWGRLLPLVAPVAAMVVHQSVLIGFRLREESARRKWFQDTFGRYNSPEVVEYLEKTPGAVNLGGERKLVTVLFSDIRSFTEMSESMEPEQVTRWLNVYLEKMVEVILSHGGRVDKFIGDGIMVVWNFPMEQPDHARLAVLAAVEMQRAVESNAAEWQAMGLPAFRIGVGIHTGPAVVGNIGTPRKMELTPIGDTINVASRLEGLCKTAGKAVGSSILLSETTWQAAQEQAENSVGANFKVVSAGDVEIRGKSQPMQVYAVL